MSNQHTSVYRWLVGVGNTAATVNGTYPSTTGQFAVMSPTGGAASSTEGADFMLLVKTATGDVRTGVINKAMLRYANATCNVAAVSPVIDVRGICAVCDTAQSIKVRFRAANVWQLDGTDYVKTYTFYNTCCTADSADCVALVQSIRDQINTDEQGLFTAVATNPTDNTTLDNTALASWDADADGCPNLRLTAVGQSIASFCGIPYIYDYPTGVSFDVTLDGFNCCSAATTVQVTSPVYAEGAGADVKYNEWSNAANAQNGTVPVITESGVVFSRDLNASDATSYALITIAVNDTVNNTFITYPDPKTYVLALPINQNTATVALVRRIDDLLGTNLEASLAGCFTWS